MLSNNQRNWVKGVTRYCAGPVWAWLWALVIGCTGILCSEGKYLILFQMLVLYLENLLFLCDVKLSKADSNMLMTAYMLSNIAQGKCWKFPVNRPKPAAARWFVKVLLLVHNMSLVSLKYCLCVFFIQKSKLLNCWNFLPFVISGAFIKQNQAGGWTWWSPEVPSNS